MIKCYNQLELFCNDKHEIFKFHNENIHSDKRPLSFEKQVPVELHDNGSIDFFDCSERWGTKYDAFDFTFVQRESNKLIYCFHTIAYPPTTWLCNIAEKYPNIRFQLEYKQGNSSYWGKQNYKDGFKVLEDVIHSTDSNSPRRYDRSYCIIQ